MENYGTLLKMLVEVLLVFVEFKENKYFLPENNNLMIKFPLKLFLYIRTNI